MTPMTLSTVPMVGDLVDVNPEARCPLDLAGGPWPVLATKRVAYSEAFKIGPCGPYWLYPSTQFLIQHVEVAR